MGTFRTCDSRERSSMTQERSGEREKDPNAVTENKFGVKDPGHNDIVLDLMETP